VKSISNITGEPTPSDVKIYVYDSLEITENPVAVSNPVTITTEQDYVIPLSATVAVAYPMLIQFECIGPYELQFAVFTTYNEPLTTMSPVLFLNEPPTPPSIGPFGGSFVGGYYCEFSLV
jgi:hypothetical protein